MRDAEQRAAADALLPAVQVVQGGRPAKHRASRFALLSPIASHKHCGSDLRLTACKELLLCDPCILIGSAVDHEVEQAASWLGKSASPCMVGRHMPPVAGSESTHMARAIDAKTSSEHIALLVCALNFWLWYCVPPTRKQHPARRTPYSDEQNPPAEVDVLGNHGSVAAIKLHMSWPQLQHVKT